MYNTQMACCIDQRPEDVSRTKNVQFMEKCFALDFQRRLKVFRKTKRAPQEVAQYIQKKFLFPTAENVSQLGREKTFMYIQALCEAAYRTNIPLSPYALLYLQSQAEKYCAVTLADYMQTQTLRFRKMQTWLKKPGVYFHWLPRR